MNPDAERQYEYWLACRGGGIMRSLRKDASRQVPSKRRAKQAGKPLRKARSGLFKWAMLTGGANPPLRNKFGLP